MVDLAQRFGSNLLDLFTNQEFGLDVLIVKVGLEFAEDALKLIKEVITALLGSLSDLLLELANAMNTEMKVPVLGPLYSFLTNGATLDLVCLILAIPTTILYKKIMGSLPTEEKGYQQLVQLDALKGALDARMSHIKSGGKLSKSTGGNPSFKPMSFQAVDHTTGQLDERSSRQVARMAPTGTDQNVKHPATRNTQESAKVELKRPLEHSKRVKRLLSG